MAHRSDSPCARGWPCAAAAHRLHRPGRRRRYRSRRPVVEPVFGQIEQTRGFRQFLIRRLTKVRAESAMI